MPLLNAITTPYAEAFLQVVGTDGSADAVVQEARNLLALWHESPELREAMASPVLEVSAKKAALTKLFEGKVSPSLLNLLKLLADRQRIGYLDAVLERVLDLYREQNDIALATVTSAAALSDEQKQSLTEKVKSVAGTDKVEIDTKIDPSLIGGFVLKVGSRVIDASLSGQVRRLGLALAKVS
ncbi:ATP synthase F1 subunit delta [Cyanobium sp. FGCU-52]|nr:ATP synthase F1 subunit delta [Cyanobium sp. FGCU52]